MPVFIDTVFGDEKSGHSSMICSLWYVQIGNLIGVTPLQSTRET